MTVRTFPLVLLLLLASALAGCASPADDAGSDATATTANASRSPYVGEENRTIKALSAEDVQALLAGEGHGYAKAAELNHYPGPAHVLDLADELGLSDDQREQVEAIRDAMKEDAVRLGSMVVDAEADLDALFASGEADASRVEALTLEIGQLEGELRAVHLNAHLETRALLTHEQVMRYDELRGYSGGGDASTHAGHDAHGGH
jgi:Spy/CpxP family protein refolding chaperone